VIYTRLHHVRELTFARLENVLQFSTQTELHLTSRTFHNRRATRARRIRTNNLHLVIDPSRDLITFRRDAQPVISRFTCNTRVSPGCVQLLFIISYPFVAVDAQRDRDGILALRKNGFPTPVHYMNNKS
jgi:predicted pyridoxine 5'-phosphate oxidase superfamily flavin-nucleotide-binding protein